MKELSIEEKAKAYDEAIERAKKWYNAPNVDKIPTFGNRVIDEIFPELKESEDERIRKELLDFCKNRAENYPNDPKYKNISAWIAWLEKQGKNNMGISEATKQKLEDNLNKALEKETPESWNKFLKKQGEQKPAWSEEDEEIIRSLLDIIYECHSYGKCALKLNEYSKLCDWLKSLRPKNTWKPSDEQMVALQEAMNIVGILTITGSKINSLYQDLKKLKG